MRTDLDRLRDACDYAAHALGIMEGLATEDVTLDRDRFQSLLFDIAVIGTTLAKVSGAVLNLDRDVPWRNVIATRNRVVHAYWQIDLTILSTFMTIADVELLVAALTRLIAIVEGAEA